MKGVKIQLDRERTLRFDAVALADLERVSGMSIIRMLRTFANQDLPFHLVLAMLYAGLQHELPGFNERQIAELVDKHVRGGTMFEKVLSLAGPCSEALVEALPKPDESEDADGPAKNVEAPGSPGELTTETAELGAGSSSSSSDSDSVSSLETSGTSPHAS